MRQIVIFERDERYTTTGKPELDFRIPGMILPAGAIPLGIICSSSVYILLDAQYFSAEEVYAYALTQSGATNLPPHQAAQRRDCEQYPRISETL